MRDSGMHAARKPVFGLPLAILTVAVAAYGAGWLHGKYLAGSLGVAHRWFTTPVSDLDNRAGDTSDGHDHAHSHATSPETPVALTLSPTARKNLGLTEQYIRSIELQNYTRSVSFPAIVVDQPGRTRIPISASMTGIVTHVHVVAGEAVRVGDLVLEMRLTHEDLVTAQKEFLQSLGERDIERKEIARIQGLIDSGAIPSKSLLDRQYSLDKVESLLNSEREALRLHGLSELQIHRIETDRRLLTEIKVYAPQPDDHSHHGIELSMRSGGDVVSSTPLSFAGNQRPRSLSRLASTNLLASGGGDGGGTDFQKSEEELHADDKPYLVLQDLQVQKGDVVNAGGLLCVLADYSSLLIEGQAFENEANVIINAKLNGWLASALVGAGGEMTSIDNLEIGWVNNQVDSVTRILRFFVLLPNSMIQESRSLSDQVHIAWKYRTGQRMQLLVPVEKWVDQIVVPIEAVASEGFERYVFQQNGDRFERVAVHERYRDQMHVVLENDGSIYPGDVIAMRGAHQMLLAIKNQSGGAVDPHAGHSH
jgi:membrane fusion protein, heavy metal efflux system